MVLPASASQPEGFTATSSPALQMNLIRPFRALRPLPERAAEIAAPPYDVLTGAEARRYAAGNPWSFLRVSKAEIDLPESVDPYSGIVYEKARANLDKLIACGALRRDRVCGFYAYRLEAGLHVQTGLGLVASVQAYRDNRIKRHELTRPDKETDRVRHMEALGAQTGPAMLAYPRAPEVDRLLAESTIEAPDTAVTAIDGVRHSIWPITRPGVVDQLTRAFESLPALYIADGHHRIAAAERVATAPRSKETAAEQARVPDGFLAVAFPHHAMRILDYNRVVTDLGGLSESVFLERVGERFDVFEASGQVRPAARGEFGLYLPGRWFRLRVHQNRVPLHDPVARLDVSILAQELLGPILSITDLRRDSRIDFVGGIRGLDELERRVASDMAAAFALYPTAIEDLMAVADHGDVMPPKSTWFEPKLADGLLCHVLEDR
jgi:uncharacterized protein (DUF1015 family)